MTTELERYTPTNTLALAPQAWSLAQRIARTEFVPAALRGKPEAVLACMLSGNEVGVSPMQALAKIHIIDGRPAMAAELMRAIVLRDGHELWIEESSSTSCTVAGQRKGSARETRVTWTLDDAQRAGLKGKKNWQTYPTAMLLARATGALCRAIFPDVLAGISYTAEELEDGDVLAFPEDVHAPEPNGAATAPAQGAPTRARASRNATRGADTPGQTEPDPEPKPEREEPALPGEDDDDIEDAEIVERAPEDDPELDEHHDGDDYEGPDQDLTGPAYSGPQIIGMRFGDRGVTDRAQRLELVSKIVDREVTSTKDLTTEEIGLVLDVVNDEARWAEKIAAALVGSAPRGRRRRVDEDPASSSPPASASPQDPDGWNGDRWRDFLKARGVKVTEVLREASRLARDEEKPAPATLDDVTGSGLARLLVGFVEDLSLERKGSSS